MIGLKFFNAIKLIYIVLRLKFTNKIKMSNKYVLFPNEWNFNEILAILPLYLSIYKAGYKIGIYLSLRSIHLIPIYLLLGVSRFHFIITFRLTLLKYIDYQKIFDYKKYLYPSIMRLYKSESVEAIPNNNEVITNLNKKVSNLLNNFSKINFRNISAVFFSDYVYVPQGPMIDYLNNYYPNIDLFFFLLGIHLIL